MPVRPPPEVDRRNDQGRHEEVCIGHALALSLVGWGREQRGSRRDRALGGDAIGRVPGQGSVCRDYDVINTR